jgi:hypothetical protein
VFECANTPQQYFEISSLDVQAGVQIPYLMTHMSNNKHPMAILIHVISSLGLKGYLN